MQVRKTFEHKGITLAHGEFTARETEHICAARCTELSGDGEARLLVRRQPQLARLLLPRSAAGYDLMARVGVERFLGNRQREEIRADIEAEFGVRISAGEVSELAKKFCVYLAALHRARAGKLRALFESDGGWPLHIDATGEDGKGTLLVVYAGWRGLVLGAWKIPTERADAILPRIRETAALFGAPRSLMHDLGRAQIEACHEYALSQGGSVVDLVCHMHFVADIGKDLLENSHDALRALFRRFKIAARLRAFARNLGRKVGTDIDHVREQVEEWFADDGEPYQLPAGKAGLGVVRAMAQWALDYSDDGTDKGFPFDRPWHDFYLRCAKLGRAIEAFLGKPHHDNEAYKELDRLFAIVKTVRTELPFGRQAAIIASRADLLDELRQTLQLELKPKGRNEAPRQVLSPRDAAAQLNDIEKNLAKLTLSLCARAPARALAQDTSKANEIVLTHLEKYGPHLFGHLIDLPESAGGGFRIAARTNVMLEQLFHILKHSMRRCSGRKNLGQDLEHMPPEATLALNLKHADYLAAVCGGSLDNLATAFAELDAGHRDLSLPARNAAASTPNAGEIVSSSMPTIDRKIVRTEAVTGRIETAARSRAMRLS